ncbi:MAG: hypothetical protein AB1757_26080 [Acidobacteriota bacterium]
MFQKVMLMRRNCLLILISFFSLFSLTNFGLKDGGQVSAKLLSEPWQTGKIKTPLQLTIKILKKKYCNPYGSQHDRLQLRLQLKYSNVSQRKVILYKYSNIVFKKLVADTLERAKAGRYKQIYDVSYEIVGQHKPFDKNKPNSAFVILAPKRSLQINLNVSLVIAGHNQEKDDDYPDSGTHFLQISVLTWNNSIEEAEELRERWHNIGEFWFNEITSEPMLFQIEKYRQVKKDCDS